MAFRTSHDSARPSLSLSGHKGRNAVHRRRRAFNPGSERLEDRTLLTNNPTAVSSLTILPNNGASSVNLSGSDSVTPDSALLFTITALPQSGSLYTPNGLPVSLGQQFTGSPSALTYNLGPVTFGSLTDSFSYIVTDTLGLSSAPATATFTTPTGSEGIVRVEGTLGNNAFDVQPASDGVHLQVTLNGTVVSKTIPLASISQIRVFGQGGNDALTAGPLNLTFDGAGGTNTATLKASTGVDSATLSPNAATLTGSAYSVSVSNVTSTTVQGNARDTAYLYDSSGNDAFLSTPATATLSGTGYSNTATSFGKVYGYSTAGIDTASLSGASSADTLNVSPTVDTLVEGTGSVTVSNFSQVSAVGTSVAASTNRVVGPNTSTVFNITGANSGNADGVSFSGFGNLSGGTGNNTFVFNASGTLSGTLYGGVGNNTLDESAYTKTVAVNLALGTVTGVGRGFSNIQTFIGSATGLGLLTGPAAGSTYNVTGVNTLNVAGVNFSNYSSLFGGVGNDNVKFTSGGRLFGGITGGGGNNTVDVSGLTTNVTLNLAASTITGSGGTLSAIQNFIGNNASGSVVVGSNSANVFYITGANSGFVAATNFSGFGSLTGGSSTNGFVFAAAGTLSGSLIGGGGANTLDESAYTKTVAVNLALGTATGVGKGFSNIQSFVGSATGLGLLTGPAADSTYNVTGVNTLNVAGVNFRNYSTLFGGVGNDTFKFGALGSLYGGITGGGGSNTLDMSALTTNVTLNLAASTITRAGGTISSIQTFIGNNGSGSLLYGPNAANVFNITGPNAGTVAGLNFFGFGSLAGGFSSSNNFVFAAGGTLSGTVFGAGGSNTIDESAYTRTVAVNLALGTMTGVGRGCSNIQTFIGSATGLGLLTGPTVGSTYNVTGVNTLNVAGVNFSNYSSLFGGVGNDNVKFTSGGRLFGGITGGGGNNTVDVSGLTTNVTLNLAASTITGSGGTLSAIQNFIGNNASGSVVVGSNSANVFYITGANSGFVAATNFSGFGSLTGGSSTNGFVFAAAGTLSGSLIGGGGANTLDESAYTKTVAVNLALGTVTGVGKGYSNVQAFIGSAAGYGLLTGPATGASFNITSANTLNVAGVTFTNYSTLFGGPGSNLFKFSAGARLFGGITGGSGTNTIDLSRYTTSLTLNLANSTITGTSTAFSNIQSFIGNNSPANLIVGPNTGSPFTITAGNAGSVAGVGFTGFGNLTGGSSDDSFALNNGGSLTGSINGGGGTNVLDYTAYTSPASVNLATGKATGVGGTVSNIQQLRGVPNTDTLSLTSSATTSTFGQALTFTATVNFATATGLVTFYDGSTVLNPGGTMLAAGAVASITLGTLSVGTHQITASYAGDANNLPSTATALTVSVAKDPTTTVVSLTPNPSVFGQSLTITATVSPTAASGLVTFYDGTTILNPGGTALSASGTASLTLSTLSTGSHQIKATYAGDGNDLSSTSAPINETITPRPSTTTVSASSTSPIYGQSITLTASVNPTSSTGTVYFYDGTTILNPSGSTVNSSGTASFTLASFTVGTHQISAGYGGDTNDLPSTSSVLPVTVAKDPTTTVVTLTPNPSVYAQTLTITATVSPTAASGLVTFYDGATILNPGGTALGVSGKASFSISTLNAGSHQIKASYAGDGNDLSSTSASVNDTITQRPSSTTISASTSSSIYGQSITFTASVNPTSSTGTVYFYDGSTILNPSGSTVNNSGTASFTITTLAVGSHQISASYSGDINDLASSSSTVASTVAKDPTTTVVSLTPNPSVYGQSLTITATISPASATGLVSFYDGATILNPGGTAVGASGSASFAISTLNAGSHQIKALYSGDANDLSSTSTSVNQTINQRTTTTTISASPTSSIYGQPVTLTASVNPGSTTGTVYFYDGATILNPIGAAVNGSGTASFTVTSLTVGSHQINAVYGGDANNLGSTSIATTEVVSTIVYIPDPVLYADVLNALGLPSGHLLTTTDMANLSTLYVDSSQIHTLNGLSTATNLKTLELVPSDFSKPANLTTLFPLQNLAHLTSLTLQGCGITDATLAAVPSTSFPALQSLDLRYNTVNVIPSNIASLPILSNLSLYGNPLAGTPRSGLANLAGKLVNIDLPPDHPQLATSVADLAAALYYLPIEEFTYVSNSIAYQPYQGSMKGPVAVIQTKSANDWDTDALLQGLFAQSSATPLPQYATGQVQENVQTVMKWLGVKTPASAYEVLFYAGLRPSFGTVSYNSSNQPVFTSVAVSQANTAPYLSFDHTWLQETVTVSGTGSKTYSLDPSWKFADFQPGLPDLLDKVAFNQSGYLSSVTSQLAYEYYETQVRQYLATNNPSMTIADVAYQGPIRPVSPTSLPTSVPFDFWTSQNVGTSIPSSFANRIEISVDIQAGGTLSGGSYNSTSNQTVVTASTGLPFTSGMVNEPLLDLTHGSQSYTILSVISGNQVVVQGNASSLSGVTFAIPALSTLQNVADISLDRVTISAPGTGQVTPVLTLTGPVSLTVRSTLSIASTGTLYPVLQYIAGGNSGEWNYSNTHVYSRTASQYLAIGIDAGQQSDQRLIAARAVVNTADITLADGGTPSNDDLIGGVLNLALVDYYQQVDHGNQVIGGLTGAIPIYNVVAMGIASSNATTSTSQNANEQVLYLPGALGIDLPQNAWDSVGIDDPAVSTPGTSGPNQATDSARDSITGLDASSMEGGVWQDIANAPALSTVTSLQYANQNNISIATITPSNLNSISSILSGLQDARYSSFNAAVISSVTAWVNQSTISYDYRVMVPTKETPYGTDASNQWVGVGYIVQQSVHGANNWMNVGFIIQGYLISNGVAGPLQAPHGGADAGIPNFVYIPPSQITNIPIGDPINIANGDVINSATDINIPNLGVPLTFQRHYSSIETVTSGTSVSDRGMGDGWSFTYGDTLTASGNTSDPAGTLIWFTDTGIQLKFTPNGSGGYVTPPTIYGTLTSNGSNQGFTWTSNTGQVIKFSPAGKLVSMADRYGNGVAVAYDSNGHIATVSDLVTPSRNLTFTWTGNRISSIADFTGRSWNYTYGSTGELSRVTDPSDGKTLQAITQYAYYSDKTLNNLLKSVTDADGNQTSFAYYVNRRGFQVTNASGQTQSVSDNIYRNQTTFTDENGNSTIHTYDTHGNETMAIAPDGTTVSFTYTNDLVTASTDSYGQTTSYVYNANGKVTKETNPLGQVTNYTYTDYSNPLTVTRASDGAKTTYVYYVDASGKNSSLKQVIDALGNVTTYTYPTVNRGIPSSMTSPNGNLSGASGYTTSYTYNTAGQVISTVVSVATGQTITVTYAYDSAGNQTQSTDGNGNVTTKSYDLLNRLISETLPDPDGSGALPAPNTTYTYDALGNLLKSTITTASPNRTTSYGYDPMQRRIQTTSPDGTYVTSSYDAVGNALYTTDALGRTTQQIYDGRNRAIETIRPDGSVLTTGYDGGSRVVRTSDPRGNTTTSQYDKLGRKIAMTTPDPDGSGPLTAATTSYGYDAQGNLVNVTDALGTSLGDPNHTTTYQYDMLGRRTAVLQPEPNGGGLSTRPTATYSYDANGNLFSTTDPRGNTTSYTYDQANRKIAQIQAAPGYGSSLGALTTRYFYDNDGNAIDVVNPLGTNPSQTAYTTEYKYDALNRVIVVMQPAPNLTVSTGRPTTTSAYDRNGNLVSMTDPLGNVTRYQYNLEGERTATSDALGNTTTTIYDSVGNPLIVVDALGRTTVNQYDAMNRVIQQIQQKPDATVTSNPVTTSQYDSNGNLIQKTDPLGHSTWYRYDALNRLVAVTDALASYSGDPWNTSTTTYDELGRVIAQTDQLSRTTQFVYDNLGRKVETIQPDPDDLRSVGLGNGPQSSPTSYSTYDANGNQISTTDPLGHVTSYTFDTLNRLVKTTNALAGVTSTSYDALGNVAAVTDPLGRTTQSVYDNLSRKIQTIQPDPGTGGGSPVTQFAYDADGNLLSTTDPLGHVTKSVYDALNRVTQNIDALNHTTTKSYDADGELSQVVDPNGNKTSYVYDGLGRLVSDTNALNHTESFAYDAVGNLVTKTDRDGQVTTYAYDPLNRQTTESWLNTAGGVIHTTSTYYDAAGEVVGVIDPGATYSYTYDGDGRVIQTRMAPGDLAQQNPLTVSGTLNNAASTIGWSQDGSADPYVSYAIPLTAGETVLVTLTSTAFSPVILVQSPSGSSDALRVAENAGSNQVSFYFTADASGTWYIAASERGSTSGTFTLTVHDNLNLIDGNGTLNSSSPKLTVNGIVNSQPYAAWEASLTTGENIELDLVGVTGFAPVLIAYGPNGETDIWLLSGSGSESFSPSVSGVWTFFVTSQSVTSGTFTLLVNNDTGPFVSLGMVQTTNTYDANGNLTQLTDSTGETANYLYDSLNRLTQVTQDNGSTVTAQAAYTYRADGSVSKLTRYSNAGSTVVATTSYSYDGLGRLVGLVDVNGNGVTLVNDSWTFNAAGLMTKMTTLVGVTNYTYDNTNQLLSATSGFQPNEGYTYDANGNRTNAGYVTGPTNQLLSDGVYNYAYDNNGNLILRTNISDHSTTVYSYDYRNRLSSVVNKNSGGVATQIVTYTYDASNQMIRRGLDSDGAGAAAMAYTYTDYQLGNAYLLISDTDPNGLAGPTVPSLSQRYLFAPVVDQLLEEEDQSSGTTNAFWGLGDHEGTIRDVVDNSGAVVDHREYNSFGQLTSATNPSIAFPFGYTGQRFDSATGLLNLNARWYNPSVGRFINEDPTGFRGGDTDLYRYVNNNPMTMVDPTGLRGSDIGNYQGISLLDVASSAASVSVNLASLTKGTLNSLGFEETGTLNLYSGKWATPLAMEASGYTINDTPYYSKANFNQEILQITKPNYSQAEFNAVWGKESSSLTIDAVLNGRDVRTLNFLDDPFDPANALRNGEPSVQIGYERPSLRGAATFAGLMNVGPGLGMIGSSLWDDNTPMALRVGEAVAGTAQVLGGGMVIYGGFNPLTGFTEGGTSIGNPEMFGMSGGPISIGSKIASVGGGVGGALMSGWSFYNDAAEGKVLTSFGDAMNVGGGVLQAAAPFVQGTSVTAAGTVLSNSTIVASAGGAAMGIGGAVINGVNAYDAFQKGNTAEGWADTAGSLGGLALTYAAFAGPGAPIVGAIGLGLSLGPLGFKAFQYFTTPSQPSGVSPPPPQPVHLQPWMGGGH